jgi:outer membrane protein assembly factor BamD
MAPFPFHPVFSMHAVTNSFHLSRTGHLVLLTLLAMSLLLGGCNKDKEEMEDIRTAESLYIDAKRMLDNGAYDRAIFSYKQLQTRFPFGRYTEQAQLELAYAYHKVYEPENALAQADRFIRTYPTHPNVDYAYFLRGLINYSQNKGMLSSWFPNRAKDRDQSASRDAFNNFDELIRRFPDSRYVPDAKERMAYLRNNLAEYEIAVGEYYLRRKAYIASANRARFVLETYPGSPSTADAMRILTVSYTGLDMPLLAQDSLQIMELNFPDDPYITGEGSKRSWFGWLWPFD